MIRFTNLNKSPMTAFSPEWQEVILKRVNEEYQEQVIEVSNEIRDRFKEIEHRIQPGFYGTAFDGILKKVHRYAYIKNVKDQYDAEYDVEIDLALHTIRFIEILK